MGISNGDFKWEFLMGISNGDYKWRFLNGDIVWGF